MTVPNGPGGVATEPVTYSASIWTVTDAQGVSFELCVRPGSTGDMVLGPVDLGVPPHHPVRINAAQSAADQRLAEQGWQRVSGWDHDAGEMFADVERQQDGTCTHCRESRPVRRGVIAYHSWPPMTRQVCPGSRKPPAGEQ